MLNLKLILIFLIVFISSNFSYANQISESLEKSNYWVEQNYRTFEAKNMEGMLYVIGSFLSNVEMGRFDNKEMSPSMLMTEFINKGIEDLNELNSIAASSKNYRTAKEFRKLIDQTSGDLNNYFLYFVDSFDSKFNAPSKQRESQTRVLKNILSYPQMREQLHKAYKMAEKSEDVRFALNRLTAMHSKVFIGDTTEKIKNECRKTIDPKAFQKLEKSINDIKQELLKKGDELTGEEIAELLKEKMAELYGEFTTDLRKLGDGVKDFASDLKGDVDDVNNNAKVIYNEIIEKEKQRDLEEKQRYYGELQIETAYSSIFILTTLASFADKKMANDFSTFANEFMNLYQAAKKFEKTMKIASAEKSMGFSVAGNNFETMATVNFYAAFLKAGYAMYKLSQKIPSFEEVVIEQLIEIRQQIAYLQEYMTMRFDLIDEKLNLMFDVIVKKLDIILEYQKEEALLRKYLGSSLRDIEAAISSLDYRLMKGMNVLHDKDLIDKADGIKNRQDSDDLGKILTFAKTHGVIHSMNYLKKGDRPEAYSNIEIINKLKFREPLNNLDLLVNLPYSLFGASSGLSDNLPDPFSWLIATGFYYEIASICIEKNPSIVIQNELKQLIQAGNDYLDGIAGIYLPINLDEYWEFDNEIQKEMDVSIDDQTKIEELKQILNFLERKRDKYRGESLFLKLIEEYEKTSYAIMRKIKSEMYKRDNNQPETKFISLWENVSASVKQEQAIKIDHSGYGMLHCGDFIDNIARTKSNNTWCGNQYMYNGFLDAKKIISKLSPSIRLAKHLGLLEIFEFKSLTEFVKKKHSDGFHVYDELTRQWVIISIEKEKAAIVHGGEYNINFRMKKKEKRATLVNNNLSLLDAAQKKDEYKALVQECEDRIFSYIASQRDAFRLYLLGLIKGKSDFEEDVNKITLIKELLANYLIWLYPNEYYENDYMRMLFNGSVQIFDRDQLVKILNTSDDVELLNTFENEWKTRIQLMKKIFTNSGILTSSPETDISVLMGLFKLKSLVRE